jgi:hypothetical protein
MSVRGWGNGFAVAGLVLAAGVAVGQAPAGSARYWIVLGVSFILALLAIALLRPKGEEQFAQQLAYLRSQITDRDIAFLRAGTQAITFPATLSEHSVAFAPLGEKWDAETKEKAETRGRKLISLRLLESRGTEVETSELGHSVIAFDEALKIKRKKRAKEV